MNKDLKDFFNNRSQVTNSQWTHMFQFKKYQLNKYELRELYDINPKPGSFYNLEEKNIGKRIILDFDFPHDGKIFSERWTIFLNWLTQIMKETLLPLTKPYYIILTVCNERVHVHFLNLYYDCSTHYKWWIENIKLYMSNEMLKYFDEKGGQSHFQMFGSLKKYGNNQERNETYKVFNYLEWQPRTLKWIVSLKIPKLWPFKCHLFELLSLQRKITNEDYKLIRINFNFLTQTTLDSGINSISSQNNENLFTNSNDDTVVDDIVINNDVANDDNEDDDNDIVSDNSGSYFNDIKSRKKRKKSIDINCNEKDENIKKKRKKKEQIQNDSSKQRVAVSKSEYRISFFQDVILNLPESFAENYNLWIKIGFLIINFHLEEKQVGRNLFHAFSQKNKEKYNAIEVNDKYTELWDSFSSNKITWNLSYLVTPSIDINEKILLHHLKYSALTDKLDIIKKVCLFIIHKMKLFRMANSNESTTYELCYYKDGIYECVKDLNNILVSIHYHLNRILIVLFNDVLFFKRFLAIKKIFPNIMTNEKSESLSGLWHCLMKYTKEIELTPNVLVFKNGYVYHLDKAKYLPYSEKYVSRTLIDVDPKEVTKKELDILCNLLQMWFPDKTILTYFLQMIRTFLAVGNHFDRGVYILIGPAGNGKTLLSGIIENMFNNPAFIVEMPTSELIKPTQLTATFVNCYGEERICILRDFPCQQLTEFSWTFIKRLSGSDKVSSKIPYLTKNFTKLLGCKILITTNEKPIITPDKEALADRLRFIPMNYKFTNTHKDRRDLMTKENQKKLGAALLALTLKSWTNDNISISKLLTEFKLPRLEFSDQLINQLLEDNDPLREFYVHHTMYLLDSDIHIYEFKSQFYKFIKQFSRIAARSFSLTNILKRLATWNVEFSGSGINLHIKNRCLTNL